MPSQSLPSSTATSRESAAAAEPWLPRPLLAILLGGLVVRVTLVVWFYGQPLYVHDERDYNILALNLLRDGEFAYEQGVPASLRPPLYPAFISALYAIGGENNFTLVRSVQIALSLLTVLVVHRLAQGLYGNTVALWAAGWCAFYPSLLGGGQLLLTETLFSLWLCLGCLLMQQYQRSGGMWRLIALGLILGLGALTRSVLWLFPPFLFVYLLALGRARSWQARLLEAAIPGVALCLTVVPWAARNTYLQRTFTAVDVMGGRNFMMGNYEHTPENRPWDAISMEGDLAWHAVLRQRYPAEMKGMTQGQIDKLAMRYGIDYVRQHPGQTLRRDIAKLFHFWQLERELPAGLARGYWGNLSKPWILALSLIIVGAYVLTMPLSVFGLVIVPPQDFRTCTFMLLLVAFICAVHSVVFGHSRYHLPLMPLLMIYAAAAWTMRWEILRKWRTRSFAVASLICLVLTAAWACEVAVEAARFRGPGPEEAVAPN